MAFTQFQENFEAESHDDTDSDCSSLSSGDTDSLFEPNTSASDASDSSSLGNYSDGSEVADPDKFAKIKDRAEEIIHKIGIDKVSEIGHRIYYNTQEGLHRNMWNEVVVVLNSSYFRDNEPQWLLAGFVLTGLAKEKCKKLTGDLRNMSTLRYFSSGYLGLACFCFNTELSNQHKYTKVRVPEYDDAVSCSCRKDVVVSQCESRARRLEKDGFISIGESLDEDLNFGDLDDDSPQE
jgi:hypothetical protein